MSDDRAQLKSFLLGLKDQLALFQRLAELNKRQRALAQSDQFETLDALLEDKEGVMARFDELERRMTPLRRFWIEQRDGFDGATLEKIDRLVAEVQRALEEVISLEDENREHLRKLRTDRGAEMRRLEQGRKLHQAYGPPRRAQEPRFLDRQN